MIDESSTMEIIYMDFSEAFKQKVVVESVILIEVRSQWYSVGITAGSSV